MEWQVIVALAVAIPVILFPVAFIWYVNIGGIYKAIKQARARRAVREKQAVRKGELTDADTEYNIALTEALKRFNLSKS